MRAVIYGLSVTAALIAVISIFWIHSQAARYMQPGVIAVIPALGGASSAFGADEIRNMEAIFDGQIETLNHSAVMIENGSRSEFVALTATGRNFFNMTHNTFIDGGPWRENDERAVVLCASAAWSLFGSRYAAGLPVDIGGITYHIAGVVYSNIQPQGQAGGFAWIAQSHNTQSSILLIQPQVYDPQASRLDAIFMLYSIDRSYQRYSIIDINTYIKWYVGV